MYSRLALLIGLTLAAALSVHASVIVLTFEGLKNFEPINQYYNGGTGGLGSGPGPNFGITFGDNALAVIDSDAGGTGYFANEPSPDTTLSFRSGPGMVMNVPAGFTTGFSFYYVALFTPGAVQIFDDVDGTGSLLATIQLPVTGSSCGGDPSGDYNCWEPVGVAFNGTAKSVNFGGTADQIGFDNITLGSRDPGNGGTPIPEPGTIGIVAGGMLVLILRRGFHGIPRGRA